MSGFHRRIAPQPKRRAAVEAIQPPSDFYTDCPKLSFILRRHVPHKERQAVKQAIYAFFEEDGTKKGSSGHRQKGGRS